MQRDLSGAKTSAVDNEAKTFVLDNVCQLRNGVVTLNNLSMLVEPGALTALIGPSGSGKTTLLRLLNRLDDPTAGSISFQGRPITAYQVRELRRRVAFVFQVPVMFPGTAAENISRPARLQNRSPVPTAIEIADLLDAVELGASFATRDAAQLSGGEMQRVALARALVSRPEVLLLDEPTAALDPEVAERLIGMLARLRSERNLTMVMVTHRLREALHVSDRLILLEGGSVVESGTTAEMQHAPRQQRTREFMMSDTRNSR
jgi:ABC-type methionine transport system ATPase subunit